MVRRLSRPCPVASVQGSRKVWYQGNGWETHGRNGGRSKLNVKHVNRTMIMSLHHACNICSSSSCYYHRKTIEYCSVVDAIRSSSVGCSGHHWAKFGTRKADQYRMIVKSASESYEGENVVKMDEDTRVDRQVVDESHNTFVHTVVPTALALMLCNMDRICLSVAMVPIASELGWAEGVQGIVQSAFLWGYLANQLVGGSMADKFGGKVVMAWGIVFFSLASALLPLVAVTPAMAALGWTLPAVLFVRFLVGLGEGVALPSMNNLVATRIEPSQRATALGVVFAGFQSGNLAGLLLSPIIVNWVGWRGLFYIFSIIGLPLVMFWNRVVPEKPKSSLLAAQNSGSEEEKEKISLFRLLKSPAVWAIIIANFANHWGYFIYLNWMPTYFVKVHGMDLRASSFVSFLPWLIMAIGSSCSGVISDALVRRGFNRTLVRKIVQSVAFLGPLIPLITLSAGNLSAQNAVMAMTLALGLTSVGQFVTNMSDIAPHQAGKLFGLCNTFGCIAGILGVSSKCISFKFALDVCKQNGSKQSLDSFLPFQDSKFMFSIS